MKNNSRIRLNPVTKEIEIEGSEGFVKSYFNKLQAMISGTAEIKTKELKPVKAAPVKAEKKQPKAVKARLQKKAMKAATKKPGEKRVTNMASIVSLIQASTEGLSTADLKEKTGLSEHQIWSIVNRAKKEGKIKKAKRGLYSSIAANQE
jgi:Mor family transcriptional regulator